MEAYAIRDGVQLALDRGLRDVVVETDAQQPVNLWKSSTYERSEVAAVLLDERELTGNFQSFSLNFVPREANELAHLCAKQCSSVRRRCFWVNYIPTFLDACIKKDCNPG